MYLTGTLLIRRVPYILSLLEKRRSLYNYKMVLTLKGVSMVVISLLLLLCLMTCLCLGP
jgi:hypothetical protein